MELSMQKRKKTIASRIGGGVLLVLTFFLISSCSPRYVFYPIPLPNTPIHEHDYAVSYAMSGTSLIKTSVCQTCGKETRETVSTGITAISDSTAAKNISPDEPVTVAVTPETVQTVLDRIGSGSTVILTAGTYDDMIQLRPTKYNDTRIFEAKGGHGSSLEDVEDNEITDKDSIPDTCMLYLYNLDNVRIIGTDGVVISEGMNIISGNHQKSYDPVREEENATQFVVHLDIDGLTIENLEISGSSYAFEISFGSLIWGTDHVTGLSFVNCTFNGEETTENVTHGIMLETQYKNSFNDISFIGCSISGYDTLNATSLYLKNINGLLIEDCMISGSGYNAIQLAKDGQGNGTFQGDIIIRNNTISSSGNSAIKFTEGIGINNSITITGNIINESVDDEGNVIEADSVTGYSVAISDNIYSGSPLPEMNGRISDGNSFEIKVN